MAAPGNTDSLGSQGFFFDLHDGSYLQYGVTSIFDSVGVRKGIIDKRWIDPATTNTPPRGQLHQALYYALNPFLHSIGQGGTGNLVHPYSDPSIPLKLVKARKWGPHAYVEVVYRHSRSTLPPISAATSATYENVYEHEPVYRRTTVLNPGNPPPDPTDPFLEVVPFVNGLPNGDVDVPDELEGITVKSNAPRSRIHKKPALRILVRTILPESPYATHPAVLTAVGFVNDGPIQFLGTNIPGTFGFGEVRYDGARVNWLGPFQFQVIYQFTATGGGFYRQVPLYKSVLPGFDPVGWGVANEQKYEATNFNNAFPVGI